MKKKIRKAQSILSLSVQLALSELEETGAKHEESKSVTRVQRVAQAKRAQLKQEALSVQHALSARSNRSGTR